MFDIDGDSGSGNYRIYYWLNHCIHEPVVGPVKPCIAHWSLQQSIPPLQWEDAADGEEDWENTEAPVSVSGVAGSFDVDASADTGVSLSVDLLSKFVASTHALPL